MPTNQITIDLNRLGDDRYMEVLTSTEAWKELSAYMDTLFVISLTDTLMSQGMSNSTIAEIIKASTQSFENENDFSKTLDSLTMLNTLRLSKKCDN
jgi:hypothetical protein